MWRWFNLESILAGIRGAATTLMQHLGAEIKRKISPPGAARDGALPWTGNVRELENRVKRAIFMVEGTKGTPADLYLDSGVGSGRQGIQVSRSGLLAGAASRVQRD